MAQEIIPAGHTEVIDPAVPATCTTTGLTEGKHCSVCDEIIVAQTTINALGHNEEILSAVAKTCTTTGLTEGKKCLICGEITLKQEIVPAGHTEVIDSAVPATCTTTGLTEGKHCSVCNEILVGQEIVDKLGHDFDNDICVVCGYNLAQFTFELNSDGQSYALVDVNETYFLGGDVVIPDSYNGKPVTKLGNELFYSCDTLTSIVIPDTIAIIEEGVASFCQNLTSVYIGKNVSYIGYYSFKESPKLASIEVDSRNVMYKSLDGNLYTKDGKTLLMYAPGRPDVAFAIPEGVTTIDVEAVIMCTNLVSIVIPDSVTTLGDLAFGYNPNLTVVTFGTNSQLTEIPGACFPSTNIKSITIPASVTRVGYGAFYECLNLTSVHFANNSQLEVVEEYAFEDCKNLMFVNFGNNSKLTAIEQDAFIGCESLTSVTFGENSQLKNINSAFRNSGIDDITIPASVTDMEFAFADCAELRTVRFEQGSQLTNMRGAFIDCTELSSINIPAGVTDISNTFCRSGLWSILIPSGVTNISGAFVDCVHLKSVEISNGVKTIDGAFNGCSALYEITIPSSVNSMGDSTFENCTSLQNVWIYAEATSIGSRMFAGCTALNWVSFGENSPLTEIREEAFYGCAKLREINLPNSVSIIGEGAFNNCVQMQEIKIPDGVISLNQTIFGNCTSLQTVYISENLQGIYGNVFAGCTGLTSFVVDENHSYLKAIDGNLYDKNGTYLYNYAIGKTDAHFEVPEGVYYIGDYAFAGCANLTSIAIPAGVCIIDRTAIDDCTNLTDIYYDGFPSGWHGIEIWGAGFGDIFANIIIHFAECEHSEWYDYGSCTNCGFREFMFSLNEDGESYTVTGIGEDFKGSTMAIPGTFNNKPVTIIGERAFYYCNALRTSNSAEIIIPDSIVSIEAEAFSDNYKVTSVTFGENSQLTTIGDNAFYACDSLTSIVIPDGVTSIGDNAFYYCDLLVEVYNYSALPIEKGSEDYGYVAYYARDLYTTNRPSKVTTDENGFVIYTNGGVKTILNYIGKDSEVIIPDGINIIGKNAFECNTLTKITFSSSVTAIDEYAFNWCTNLTSVTIPSNVTTIGNFAFYYCSNLASITISEGVKTIGDAAFGDCDSLTSVHIPLSVISIGKAPFASCDSLTEINVDDEHTSYKSVDGNLYTKDGKVLVQYAIGKTDSTFKVPAGVVVVGEGAFMESQHLYWLEIRHDVTRIGDAAFYRSSLYSVTITSDLETIGYGAFYGNDGLTSINLITDKLTTIDRCAFEDCYNLMAVGYSGTEEEWNAIDIRDYNWPLSIASIYYNLQIN